MATNQTEHYSLNQWELSDSVVMAEFNDDNQKVDAALMGLSQKIDTTAAQLAAAMPHVQSGSYIGTGTSGPDAPNTLTFGFKPVFVAIITEDEELKYAGTIRGIAPWLFVRPWKHTNKFYNGNTGANSFDTHVTWLNNGVSWYAQCGDGSDSTAGNQLNASGVIYHYVAIG